MSRQFESVPCNQNKLSGSETPGFDGDAAYPASLVTLTDDFDAGRKAMARELIAASGSRKTPTMEATAKPEWEAEQNLGRYA